MSEGERLGEIGNGKRVAVIVAAVFVVAALVTVIVAGFRGRHISRNAAAMTEPVTTSTTPGTSRSTAALPMP